MKKLKQTSALLVILVLLASLVAACSSDDKKESGDSGKDSGGKKVELKWSTWGNPGELKRFYELTDQYNKDHKDVHVTLVAVPNDGYEQKIITQLQGGTAPDVFYAGDGTIAKLIANGSITELTPLMEQAGSPIKVSDFADGLWGGARKDDKYYGVTVDCNPMEIYYNKKVLKDAGVTDDPWALYESGEWTWAKFKELTEKVRDAGKYGFVQDNWWGPIYSWVTTNGGKIYDDPQDGKFIGETDPKTVEAFNYIADNIKAKNFTYSGSLPKGQGADAMFMSNQVGFVAAGRWYAPQFNANETLDYDVVPWPVNTGSGKMEPAGIPTAYMVMNKNTKNSKEAYDFLSYFVSVEGQKFRLSGGNAVPSINGADDVVTAGTPKPSHTASFLDTRAIGYALWPAESAVPGASDGVTTNTDLIFLGKQSVEDGLKKMSEAVNKKIDEFKAGN